MKLHDYLWEYIDYQNKNPGLREAYEMGSKPLFAAVCMYQQMSDDEWHAAKAKAKKEIQEAEG